MCRVMDAPLGAITIIEHNQVWIESGWQCAAGDAPWCNALCPWILLSQHPTTLVVEDMAQVGGGAARRGGRAWCVRGPACLPAGRQGCCWRAAGLRALRSTRMRWPPTTAR
jgi:hypothetical protein